MNLYEKVNERIKNDLIELNKHDMDFKLINTIYKITMELELILSKYKINFENNNNEDYLSENEVFYEVANFFKNIDRYYYDFFIKQKNENKIIYNENIKSGYMDNDTLTINIKKTNTICDVEIMIHEMMHRLNRNDNSYYPINKYLTEFISVFFETYYTYINKQNNLDKQFINRLKHTISTINNIHTLGNLYHFYNRHEFNDKSYEIINTEINNNYTKEEFDELLNNYLLYSNNISYLTHTGYLIALLLTNYIFKNIQIDDKFIIKMKKLNIAIKDENISLSNALSIIDIDINNNETIYNILKSFDDRLNNIGSNSKKQ